MSVAAVLLSYVAQFREQQARQLRAGFQPAPVPIFEEPGGGQTGIGHDPLQ